MLIQGTLPVEIYQPYCYRLVKKQVLQQAFCTNSAIADSACAAATVVSQVWLTLVLLPMPSEFFGLATWRLTVQTTKMETARRKSTYRCDENSIAKNDGKTLIADLAEESEIA
jgi:hypothetical protein